MSETELQERLMELLGEFTYLSDDDRYEIGFESMDWLEGGNVRSFNDAGLYTSDQGIVLDLVNGEGKFQITIIRVE